VIQIKREKRGYSFFLKKHVEVSIQEKTIESIILNIHIGSIGYKNLHSFKMAKKGCYEQRSLTITKKSISVSIGSISDPLLIKYSIISACPLKAAFETGNLLRI